MKNGYDISLMNISKNDSNYTGVGDKSSKRKTIFTITLPKLVVEVQNKIFEELSEGQGLKIKIPSNIIDIYTSLEILLSLKLSGHINTLTEASKLTGDIYPRGEVQNEQQYRNALNKFDIQ